MAALGERGEAFGGVFLWKAFKAIGVLGRFVSAS